MKPAVLKPIVRTTAKFPPSRVRKSGRVTARVPIRLRAKAKELREADAVSYRESMEVTQILKLASGHCYPVCPRCKISVEREYMKFCDRCGQRLSWTKIRDAIIVYPGFNRK
jgi:tRNA(Ile2) C34 agmatinyltransferase TiaS